MLPDEGEQGGTAAEGAGSGRRSRYRSASGGRASRGSGAAAGSASSSRFAGTGPKGVSKQVTKDVLQALFHLPLEKAAKELGVSSTMVKRMARRFGIPGWPYRQLQRIDTEIGSNRHVLEQLRRQRQQQTALMQSLPQQQLLTSFAREDKCMQAINELEAQKDRILDGAARDPDDPPPPRFRAPYLPKPPSPMGGGAARVKRAASDGSPHASGSSSSGSGSDQDGPEGSSSKQQRVAAWAAPAAADAALPGFNAANWAQALPCWGPGAAFPADKNQPEADAAAADAGGQPPPHPHSCPAAPATPDASPAATAAGATAMPSVAAPNVPARASSPTRHALVQRVAEQADAAAAKALNSGKDPAAAAAAAAVAAASAAVAAFGVPEMTAAAAVAAEMGSGAAAYRPLCDAGAAATAEAKEAKEHMTAAASSGPQQAAAARKPWPQCPHARRRGDCEECEEEGGACSHGNAPGSCMACAAPGAGAAMAVADTTPSQPPVQPAIHMATLGHIVAAAAHMG